MVVAVDELVFSIPTTRDLHDVIDFVSVRREWHNSPPRLRYEVCLELGEVLLMERATITLGALHTAAHIRLSTLRTL